MAEETGQAPAPDAEAPYNPLTKRPPINRMTPDEFAEELVRRSRQTAPEEQSDDKAEPETSEAAAEQAQAQPEAAVERPETPQEAQEAETDTEAPSEDDAQQADSEEGQPEAEDEATEQSEARLADDDAVVDLDGEQLSIRELKDGYLRRQDYTAKRMDEAKARKEESAVNRQQFEQLLQATQIAEVSTVNVLAGIDQELSQFQNIDWQQLQADNPATYESLRQQQASILTRRRQAEAQYEQVRSTAIGMFDDHKARQAQETMELMVDMFGGTQQWNQRYSELRDVAATVDIPPEEFAELRDHRLMTILHRMDSAERELADLKALDTQKVTRAPKAPAVKRQSQAAASVEAARDRDAMGRFTATGKPADAAAIWQKRLEAEAESHRQKRKH